MVNEMAEKKRAEIFEEAWRKAKMKRGEDFSRPSREDILKSEEDFNQRFEKIKEKFGEITDLIEKNYKALNTSRDECRTFLGNPDNFTTQQRKSIEMGRKLLNEELFKENAKKYSKALAKKNLKKSTKKRKRKMLGARKKGWIPM